MSVVNGIVPYDFGNDGKTDLILAGNFYPFRVQIGPCDASIGLVLENDGKGEFTPLPYAETGLHLSGDVRNLLKIKGKNNFFVVAAKNNGAVQIIKLRN